ncbi:MAG: hypothetical protein KatS3mg054_0642 [Chloroflexus sp.]|nr:MAG: hypothetical protein KatS3mg054_0642 [Chloroflexus sp.]
MYSNFRDSLYNDSMNKIIFNFVVARVQSLADGSPRIVIDLQEQDIDIAAMLWQAKTDGLILRAEVTASASNERKSTE